MTTTPPLYEIDGHDLRDALCVARTEELAMEIAAWLFNDANGRLAHCPPRLLKIIDSTDDPGVRGYAVFWPNVSDRGYWPKRLYQRQGILKKFAGRGVR